MTTEDNEGPAPPGSPLRNVLDLLIARGCKVEYVPGTKSDMEVYKCYYARPNDIGLQPLRCRLFYSDSRGADQAMGLLMELNTGVGAGMYQEEMGT